MYKYICPNCKSNQYSSSENKGNEPCVYCGHGGTELVGVAGNEKAPEVLADNQGADIKTQLDNTTKINENQISKYILTDMIDLNKRFQQLYNKTGLIDFSSFGIHLKEREFLDTFDDFDTKTRDSQEYPEELSAEFNGTRFFCIR